MVDDKIGAWRPTNEISPSGAMAHRDYSITKQKSNHIRRDSQLMSAEPARQLRDRLEGADGDGTGYLLETTFLAKNG